MNTIHGHSFNHICLEIADQIAHLTMAEAETRNALSVSHMQELTTCLSAIGEEPNVAAVILKGNGPAFCAGHDLRELTGQSPEFYRNVFDTCTKLMDMIQAIPQPVIAQVHGIATAAGCQLVATCDLAVAADTARFATPGVKIGLFCSTPMVATSRNINRKKMLEMLFTGEPISAHEALLSGLVNRVVPVASLDAETQALAKQIVGYSSSTIGIGKQAFYRQLEMPQDQAYAYAKEVMSLNALSPDAHEGMCAFLEKRQPTWNG